MSWIFETARVTARLGGSLEQKVSGAINRARLTPSRASLRRGILVPGDPPPSGSMTGLLDYREILLPKQTRPLQQGLFPLGGVLNPAKDIADYPIFLDWDYIARHVGIVGPSGSGKTSNIVAPWIIAAHRAGIPVVAVDVKGDLKAEIKAAKQRFGYSQPMRVYRWDISDPSHSRAWSPLQDIRTSNDASQIAMAFLGEINPNDQQRFFAERDHRWLRGLAWLVINAIGSHVHPSILYKAITSRPLLLSLIKAAPYAASELIDLSQFSDSEYARATAGLANRLSWLADSDLEKMLDSSQARNIDIQRCLSQPCVIIVGARASGGEKNQAAAALFLNQLRLTCLERFGGNHIPVLWMLDEAGRYASRIQLEEMLTLLRGADSPVCVSVQDVAQLGDLNMQNRIFGNCDTFITLKGVSATTAQYFSSRLGRVQSAKNTMSLGQTGWQPSISYVDTPVLGEHEIMYPPVGDYGGIAQIRSASKYPFLFKFR